MLTELADAVAEDTSLPQFTVPSEIRQWGLRVRLADRSATRATAMLVETAVIYAAFVFFGESIDRWWGWVPAWTGLVMCMMRIDAIHHEAIHRSLYVRRWLNDGIAAVTGALEGFHGPTYRCFHLAHHALTRRDHGQVDPEDFYDEVLTRPCSVGPVRVGARLVLVVGVLVAGVTFVVQLLAGAVAALFGHPPAYVGAATLQRHVRRWGLVPFALWAGVFGGAVATGHTTDLLQWWLIPVLLYLSGPYAFFALPEHYGAPHNLPMVYSTGSVRSTAFYRWLTLGGNLHLAHHVFPSASWWRLGDADAQLRGIDSLRHGGYVAFYRTLWRDLAPSTGSDSAAPER